MSLSSFGWLIIFLPHSAPGRSILPSGRLVAAPTLASSGHNSPRFPSSPPAIRLSYICACILPCRIKNPLLHSTAKGFFIWISRQWWFLPRKPLDLQNNRVKPGCYQIVIKGYLDSSKTFVPQRYLKMAVQWQDTWSCFCRKMTLSLNLAQVPFFLFFPLHFFP